MRLTFEIIQESWTNQMRIDLASLYSLFDQLDKQYFDGSMAGRLARSFDPLVRSWEHSAADDFSSP